MITIRLRREKSPSEILEQVERIYSLYTKGYGTRRMLDRCESRVYVIITSINY